jgi:predicted dehydrogenase
VSATVLNDIERYGIHLLEAASTVLGEVPRAVAAHAETETAHALLRTSDGTVMSLHALGRSVKRFRLSFFGEEGLFEADLYDNFAAFRRTLHHFVRQVRTGRPAVPPADTVALMETVMALRGMMQQRERVSA